MEKEGVLCIGDKILDLGKLGSVTPRGSKALSQRMAEIKNFLDTREHMDTSSENQDQEPLKKL